MLAGDPNASQPTQFALTLFAIHAYSDLFLILTILNMPSYKNLAIIALAASSVSPVLCAPTRYGNLHLRVRGRILLMVQFL